MRIGGPAKAVVISMLLAALTGCALLESLTPEPVRGPGPAAPQSPTQAPTLTSRPQLTNRPEFANLDLMVTVAPVDDDLPEYNRREWSHWKDEDRDCQNARQEALIVESAIPVTFKGEDECRVASGRWTGPYTGTVVEDPAKLDIDHMVPLANAHRSGGWVWDRDRKAAFASDLEYDGHLIATIASANRAKGSKGPEDWRPPEQGYWCEYAIDWTTIKSSWELTVTPREFDALRDMLETCDEVVAIRPSGR